MIKEMDHSAVDGEAQQGNQYEVRPNGAKVRPNQLEVRPNREKVRPRP
jgi:hypothetical protein